MKKHGLYKCYEPDGKLATYGAKKNNEWFNVLKCFKIYSDDYMLIDTNKDGIQHGIKIRLFYK